MSSISELKRLIESVYASIRVPKQDLKALPQALEAHLSQATPSFLKSPTHDLQFYIEQVVKLMKQD